MIVLKIYSMLTGEMLRECIVDVIPRIGEYVEIKGKLYIVKKVVHNFDDKTVHLIIKSVYPEGGIS